MLHVSGLMELCISSMDNGLLIRTKNHDTSNWLAFWAVQSAAQKKSIYVEKNVSNTPLHSGSKLQKPAKIRLKNFGKLTYLLCSCRNLITFVKEKKLEITPFFSKVDFVRVDNYLILLRVQPLKLPNKHKALIQSDVPPL